MRRMSPDAADQAGRLRELMGAPRATTLAIAGGKGGVGKTNVAVNLALCLAARGRRVTLVDLDLGMANADVLLGIQTPYNLAHVLSGLRALDEVCVRLPGNLRFVSGTSGIGRLANLSEFERQRLVQQLRQLETGSDYLVLDCGAGVSRNVLTFVLAAGAAVLVTTPEPSAITDTYATIKVLVRERFAGPLHVLVNRARDRVEAEQTYRRICGVATKFLRYPLADCGYVLHDEQVEAAVRQRCPFVLRFPNGAASACVMAVASRIDATRTREPNSAGWVQRVVGLFV